MSDVALGVVGQHTAVGSKILLDRTVSAPLPGFELNAQQSGEK
jgi:hypothetical protein